MLSIHSKAAVVPRQGALAVPAVRPCLKARSAKVSVVEKVLADAPAAPAEEKVDVVTLNRKLEARAKAFIALEEQEVATRTKVKFMFQCKVGLGDVFKVVGKCPELGRYMPEVAPAMSWSNGDHWVLEVPIRPGKLVYKVILRAGDGAYIWEDFQGDRTVEVPPPGSGPIEVKLNVKVPFRG